MRITLITLLLPLFAYAQQGSIRVTLRDHSVIDTRYAYVNNNGGLFGPYVRVHHRKGEKIAIDRIGFIESVDRFGNQRYVKPVRYRFGNEIFAERTFTSERIDVYHTNIISGNWNATYSFQYLNYIKDGGLMKKVNYTNLKHDLSDNQVSVEFLKKANGYRMTQMALYGTGAALVVHGIVTGLSNNDDDLSPPGEARLKIPVSFLVGAVALSIPRFLNKPKQDFFLDALISY